MLQVCNKYLLNPTTNQCVYESITGKKVLMVVEMRDMKYKQLL